MNILVLGINHKTAPIQIRERLSFSSEKLHEALLSLKSYDAIEENLILSTCNRTETYAVVKDISRGFNSLKNFLCSFHKIQPQEIADYLYTFNDREAIIHLFRVVSSLDSMIVGETQIFGQVKDSYFKARDCNTTGKRLDSLFEEAIRIGKKVRTETQIGKGAVSTSTAAIELSRKIFESLKDKKVLIIGAGKIGELTAKNLYSRGVSTVIVANRTLVRAEELARSFCGQAIKFESIFQELKFTDIVISSTSAPHFIINYEDIRKVMQARNNSPLFLIDLGLPRNIDPKVNEIENVYLYNIDDLAQVADGNIKERQREAKKAEEIIQSCADSVIKKINLNERPQELILK
jgi:glutamyl-tRNA reductase